MKSRNITLLPLFLAPLGGWALGATALAQTTVNPQTTTTIQVVSKTQETLYFQPDTVYELPLVVAVPVTVNGRSLPRGTTIQGRLEPAPGGLRYVATGITAGGFRIPLSATSEVLTDIKDPRETSLEAMAGDAAIGAAGGAVLGAVLGDGVSWVEVLGGAAAGVAVGNVTAQRVVILEPGQTITLHAQ